MAWEYMDSLDYRYDDASFLIPFVEGDVVVDLCSGNSRFGSYLPSVVSYLSCDLYDDRAMFKMADDEFVTSVVKECDVLTLFGYGGFEVDGHFLESSTVLNSLKVVIDSCSPRIVLIENISKYNSVPVNFMCQFTDYVLLDSVFTEGSDWLSERVMNVWIRN